MIKLVSRRISVYGGEAERASYSNVEKNSRNFQLFHTGGSLHIVKN